MKISSRILVLVLLTLCGQTLAQKSSGSGDLTVRVKSFEAPIEGASVVLTSRSTGQRLNVTNADGVCEFRALPAGSYSLQVVQRGFFPADAPETDLEIQRGQSRSLDFYLVKGGVLKGRTVSTDGSPIIGVAITALKLAGKEPSLPSAKESNVTAISDDRGEFRIYGLRSGSYTVAVNVQRNASSLKSLATLFYPGERQIANATIFDLVSGQEMAVPDLVLDPTRANQNSLVGVVRNRIGKALSGVSLSLLSSDGLQISDSTMSDSQGYFTFESLPSGEYLLKASFTGHPYFDVKRQISIKDLGVNNVTLELAQHPLISGRAYLRSETGVSSLPMLKLQLEPARSGHEGIDLVTDKDGNFSERSSKEGMFWWSFPELHNGYYV